VPAKKTNLLNTRLPPFQKERNAKPFLGIPCSVLCARLCVIQHGGTGCDSAHHYRATPPPFGDHCDAQCDHCSESLSAAHQDGQPLSHSSQSEVPHPFSTYACRACQPRCRVLGLGREKERAREKGKAREREIYLSTQSTHISLSEHSNYGRLIGMGIRGVSSVSRECKVSLFGLPQGEISRSPHEKRDRGAHPVSAVR